MAVGEKAMAPTGRCRGSDGGDPLAARRARLAAVSAARGVVWAVLTVSLLGTAVTAPYLPSLWARPILILSVLGGLVSGLVTVYRLFIAFMAALGLLRQAVPGRTGGRGKLARGRPTRRMESDVRHMPPSCHGGTECHLRAFGGSR